jgi:hypothetical protein
VYRARVALIIVISFADCQLRDTFGGGKITQDECVTMPLDRICGLHEKSSTPKHPPKSLLRVP